VVRYLAERLTYTVLVLLAVSLVAFLLTHLSGNPAAMAAPLDATPQQVEDVRRALGLDRPLFTQYMVFLGRVARGDLGNSFRHRVPTLDLLAARIPPTLLLALTSLTVAVVIAVPVGVAAGVWRGRSMDLVGRVIVTLGQSAPVFWTGIMATLLLSVRWRVLPASGYENWTHLVLPAGTLGLYSASEMVRFVRNGVLDVVGEDYVRTARAKGLPAHLVLFRHVLRNALIPVVTFIGLRFGVLMGGAVVTEAVFGWPGVGSLMVDAVLNRDVPLVQATLIATAASVAVANLAVDLAYGVIDPRIAHG
jgi:ABC-type dipeptide/oligopeptide/nickel transport system permease component